MRVGIIDYGSGNFASVWNAFLREGKEPVAVDRPSLLRDCSHLVLPGVGTFGHAVDQLTTMGLIEPLRALLEKGERPFLGICVGMQILAQCGSEPEETPGLGFVPGRVDRFDFSGCADCPPLPHIGWNEVEPRKSSYLFKGIDAEDRTFYFVHSYHLYSEAHGYSFARAEYGYSFVCALEKPPIFGVQFHPEKSGVNGRCLIRNFLSVS